MVRNRNWEGVLSAFKALFGHRSYFLIPAALLLLCVSKLFSRDIPYLYVITILLVSYACFLIGVAIIVFRIFAPYFLSRPARGVLDALAASTISAVVGGYFGFAYHTGPDYKDPAFVRLLWCAIFTIPTGALIGLGFDLFQSDHKINWRLYLGGLLTAFFIGIAIIIITMQFFMPEMNGNGITLSDLYLLFSIFLFSSAIITAVQFEWTVKQCLCRGLLLLCNIAISLYLIWHIPSDSSYQLGCEFLYCRAWDKSPDDQMSFGFTIIGFIVWTLASYAALVLSFGGNLNQHSRLKLSV